MVRERGEHVASSLLVLPSELDEPGLLDRLLGRATDQLREATSVPFVLVDRAGTVTKAVPPRPAPGGETR